MEIKLLIANAANCASISGRGCMVRRGYIVESSKAVGLGWHCGACMNLWLTVHVNCTYYQKVKQIFERDLLLTICCHQIQLKLLVCSATWVNLWDIKGGGSWVAVSAWTTKQQSTRSFVFIKFENASRKENCYWRLVAVLVNWSMFMGYAIFVSTLVILI